MAKDGWPEASGQGSRSASGRMHVHVCGRGGQPHQDTQSCKGGRIGVSNFMKRLWRWANHNGNVYRNGNASGKIIVKFPLPLLVNLSA